MGVEMFKHEFKSLEVSEQSGFLAGNDGRSTGLLSIPHALES